MTHAGSQTDYKCNQSINRSEIPGHVLGKDKVTAIRFLTTCFWTCLRLSFGDGRPSGNTIFWCKMQKAWCVMTDAADLKAQVVGSCELGRINSNWRVSKRYRTDIARIPQTVYPRLKAHALHKRIDTLARIYVIEPLNLCWHGCTWPLLSTLSLSVVLPIRWWWLMIGLADIILACIMRMSCMSVLAQRHRPIRYLFG